MDRGKLNSGGTQVPKDKPRSSSVCAAAADRKLGRAQLLIECTRAVLRAREEPELAGTLCQLLVHPGIYSEASIALIEDSASGTPRRSFYAGSQKQCVKDPERFWAHPERKAALENLTSSGIADAAPSATLTLPIRIAGEIAAVLGLSTSDGRVPDADELEQLQSLADDISYALTRLREDARLRAITTNEIGLRETFEHAAVGITRIDMNGYFMEVNRKFCEMLGYSREELIGRATREVTVQGDYGPGAAFREEARRGLATVSIAEKRYLRKDGSHVWARRTMSPAYDERGRVREVLSVVEDITERKKALEAVARERTLLRTIIDAVPHYIYVKDSAGRITLVNQAWLDARHMRVEEVLGKTARQIYPPALADQMETQDQPILATGAELIDIEQHLVLPAPDGTTFNRYSLTTKMPLRDAEGAIVGLVGISRDITAAKRIEQALRDYVERFELVARATSDVIWDWDLAANTLWWGEGMKKLFHYRLDEIEPTIESWTSRIHPAESVEVTAAIHRAIDEGASAWSAEYRFRRADGSYADVYDRAYIMRDEQGKAIRMLGAMMDISQRTRALRERTMEHAVTRVLSESRSVEETMPLLMRTICEAMGWAYGARWVWDPDVSNLRRAESWADFDLEFDEADRHYWLEIGPWETGGPVRKAWMDGRLTWLTDINEDASFRRRPSTAKFGFRSAYALPIRAHGERLGVMEFFGREVHEPDEALLQVTDAIANQIGQFIRRKQAEDALQESEQQLRAMFENADVGISMTALDLRYLRVNDKFCSLLGYEREELLRMSIADVNLPENVAHLVEFRERLLLEQQPDATREKQLVRKDGSLIWLSMATSVVRASDGSPRYFMAVIQDISESKRAAAALKESEAQFRQLAHYDSLTNLPNRALFYDRLAHGLAQALRNKWALAVMFIDVDRFKHVNDTFGHAAGDQLLKKVSERLSECVRSDDTVGRLSGDEFSIVLSRLSVAEDAATVAQKIVDALNQPFQLEGAELFVTASIGITVFPADSTDQDTLIRNADVAMYRAKERGRNNYQFYTPELNRRTRAMLSMEGELRRALERDELVLHYQPKVSLGSGRITGVEALLRWRHPERGLVPPGDFIPLLEETGLIVQAGEWVLKAVCEQLKVWERAGIEAVPVAINLSARQFLAPDLAGSIRRVLEAHEVRAALVEVEITESAIMTNAEEAIRTLEYLQSLGVQTAVDDFGTGYSSLSYLKRFPLRALKVDRSFVRDITTDPDDAAITQAVISMAHSLDLKVIAEGVETEGQLSFLERYGCDEVQGYLYSRPVPGEDCGVLITAREIKPRPDRSISTEDR